MSKFTIAQVFQDHWDSFLAENPKVRPVVMEEVDKVLSCGDTANGYAMYGCLQCGKVKFVPFRCKSRFCNTCGVAYQSDRASNIAAKLVNCKHRHIVFTIPQELREYFRRDRERLNILFHAAAQTLLDWFASKNKSEHFTPGIVSGLHTFGRDLKWNPHIHILVTEGACGNSKAWRDFHHIPFVMLRKKWQTTLLVHIEKELGKEQFRLLKNRLYAEYLDGFYVHAPYSDFNSPETVANYITRYIGRPAMAQSRILNYDGETVTFWYQRHEDNERVVETIPAFDFIKRLIIHIPEKHFHMLRYYGIYAKNHPMADKLVLLMPEHHAKVRHKLRRWAWRIELSFGHDPLKCSCGEYMEFIDIFVPTSSVHPPP